MTKKIIIGSRGSKLALIYAKRAKDQLIKLTSIHQHFSYFIPESGGWKNKSCNKSRMDCKFYMVSHHNYSLSI